MQKQVRVIGRYAGDDQIEVEGIQLVGRGAQPE
ncbi:hypothetical protein FHS31_000746 [Sphingomonas vulcanisoli]|uniref:Uncharacterized protein n=1 Tax=Sphingomonas vulcanisoli TaxID=1658060 RepID=A0ABX0TNR4_9SPHN|nr:hypothetical protein [Sphingomonas vulcanisoli]